MLRTVPLQTFTLAWENPRKGASPPETGLDLESDGQD